MKWKAEYAFCETATATDWPPWHIRELTAKGRMLGGGCGCARAVWPHRVIGSGFWTQHA